MMAFFKSHLEILKVPLSNKLYESDNTLFWWSDIYYELTTFLLKYRSILAH